MRTPRKFVEDLLAKGRTPEEIRSIAAACRWRTQMDDVNAALGDRKSPRRSRRKKGVKDGH